MDEREQNQEHDERGSFVDYDERVQISWVRTKNGLNNLKRSFQEIEEAREAIHA